jgi:putative two-component system response regulator
VRIARDHTRELEDARLEVLQRLSFAAEYRDDDTREHTERIGRTSALLAGELGLPEETVALVRRAAPLHDVGKLAISDAILLKPGRLTTEEFEVMKTHVIIGAEILARSRSPLVQMSEQIALYHHERWDGTGYGSGLRGEEIPLAARIVAVADSFDALTHARPYKDPWPLPQAVAKIQSLAGEHFDPRVAQAFEALDQPALLAPVEPEPLAR